MNHTTHPSRTTQQISPTSKRLSSLFTPVDEGVGSLVPSDRKQRTEQAIRSHQIELNRCNYIYLVEHKSSSNRICKNNWILSLIRLNANSCLLGLMSFTVSFTKRNQPYACGMELVSLSCNCVSLSEESAGLKREWHPYCICVISVPCHR